MELIKFVSCRSHRFLFQWSMQHSFENSRYSLCRFIPNLRGETRMNNRYSTASLRFSLHCHCTYIPISTVRACLRWQVWRLSAFLHGSQSPNMVAWSRMLKIWHWRNAVAVCIWSVFLLVAYEPFLEYLKKLFYHGLCYEKKDNSDDDLRKQGLNGKHI